MNNIIDPAITNHQNLKFPTAIFAIFITIALLVIFIVNFSFQLGREMSANFTPLIDATMEIKLETTTAHLWFEEIISGDRHEKIETVIKHIDNAIWYANAMLEGGKNPEGVFVPLADPMMRKEIEEVLLKIQTFKKITTKRYEALVSEIKAGKNIDQEYDSIFQDFTTQADRVETKLQEVIVKDLSTYRTLQIFLIVVLSTLSVYLLYVLYRYEKQRLKNIAAIHEAYEKVKVLSGFLPICASCKKIRDDNGYWNQIESYIKTHSEAEFSHSICPDCAQKLYPDFIPKNSDQKS